MACASTPIALSAEVRKGILSVALFVILISLCWTYRATIQEFSLTWGYLGVFGGTLAASAFFLPAPTIYLIATAGIYHNPWLVGLVAGIASTVGEIFCYMIGTRWSKLAKHKSETGYSRANHWLKKKRGSVLIWALAVIPNPLFDLVGLTAGTLGFSWWRFGLLCLLGKTPKFVAAAHSDLILGWACGFSPTGCWLAEFLLR